MHMTRADATPNNRPTVLVVEDDADTRESLKMVLEDAGYAAYLVASPTEALAAIDARVFALIITDLFAHVTEHRLDAATTIRDRAYPTPVGILSGWNLSPASLSHEGFAFVASKPFDIDDLLTNVAKALATPLTAEQRRQVPLVTAYFTALSAGDWDALLSHCADDVAYVVPDAGFYAKVVTGKHAFREYARQRLLNFPDARFDQIEIYGTPQGLAARYHSLWQGHGMQVCEQAGSVVFQFDHLTIRQIGVQFNHELLSALVASSLPDAPAAPRDC